MRESLSHSLSLPVCLPVCLPACLSVCLSVCLSLSLSLSVCLSLSASPSLPLALPCPRGWPRGSMASPPRRSLSCPSFAVHPLAPSEAVAGSGMASCAALRTRWALRLLLAAGAWSVPARRTPLHSEPSQPGGIANDAASIVGSIEAEQCRPHSAPQRPRSPPRVPVPNPLKLCATSNNHRPSVVDIDSGQMNSGTWCVC